MNKEHEIQQNELAAWFGKVNTAVEPYSKLIAVVVFALIAAAVAWGLWNSKVSGDRSDATLQLLMKDPEVATKYPGTPAAAWSVLYDGNDNLESGIEALYQNREDAETMLSDAKNSFNEALGASNDRLLQSRAHLGLAMAAESLGDLDAAIKSYREVEGIGESDAMVSRAKARIEELSSPETKEFVAWFKEQKFSSADPSLPPELPSGTSLPELPDLTLPTLGGGDAEEDGDDDMQLEDKSGLELPPLEVDAKVDDAKVEMPAEKKPAAEAAPAEKKPATEEKPAEKKPAEKKPAAEKPAEKKPATEEKAAAEEKPAKKESAEKAPAESESAEQE